MAHLRDDRQDGRALSSLLDEFPHKIKRGRGRKMFFEIGRVSRSTRSHESLTKPQSEGRHDEDSYGFGLQRKKRPGWWELTFFQDHADVNGVHVDGGTDDTETANTASSETKLAVVSLTSAVTNVGYVLFTYNADEEATTLMGMLVHDDFRGRGLSKIILATWLSMCFHLGSRATTGRMDKPLISLVLQRFGFQPEVRSYRIAISHDPPSCISLPALELTATSISASALTQTQTPTQTPAPIPTKSTTSSSTIASTLTPPSTSTSMLTSTSMSTSTSPSVSTSTSMSIAISNRSDGAAVTEIWSPEQHVRGSMFSNRDLKSQHLRLTSRPPRIFTDVFIHTAYAPPSRSQLKLHVQDALKTWLFAFLGPAS
eukprot:m.184779 g.184779  ORF g.184779 m.184779 type:complete len:371 (-) comp32207_c5_seq1:71-1183(-)